MKIFVCVKQVPDTESKIRLKSDSSGIDETGIKWVLNPYDEFGLEEALKLKEAQPGSSVTVLSLGPKKRVIDAIRTALAMGADDGILIDSPDFVDGHLTAEALAKTIKAEGPFDLIFTGKLAIDGNNSFVSQAIAEALSIPHATVVSKLAYDGTSTTVERETEGGTREVIQLKGPCLIGANKGLNTPRYANLPGIIKAKKKPIKEISLNELELKVETQKVSFSSFLLPAEKAETKILQGDLSAQIAELVHLLKNESKVL